MCVCVGVLLAVCVAVDVAVDVWKVRSLCKLLARCKQKMLHSFGRVFKLTRQLYATPPSLNQAAVARTNILPHKDTH